MRRKKDQSFREPVDRPCVAAVRSGRLSGTRPLHEPLEFAMALHGTPDRNGRSRRLAWLVLIAAMCALALFVQRYSRRPGPGHVVLVSGEVFVGDEPLEEGTITFIPDPAKDNDCRWSPTGKIVGGVYELSTAGVKGAPPGWYKVILAPFKLRPSRPVFLFDRRFGNPDRTPLSAEVIDSPDGKPYDFKVPAAETSAAR